MARRRGPGSRGGKLTTRRITRGPRKGQSVVGYVGRDGKFRAARTKGGKKLLTEKGKSAPGFLTDKNTQRGNKRRGKTFIRAQDSKGRKIHRYRIKGKTVDVVVKPKKKRTRKKK